MSLFNLYKSANLTLKMYKIRKKCSICEQVDAIGLTFIRIHALIKSSAEHINNPSIIEDIPLNFPKWP